MAELKAYQEKLIKIINDLEKHGYGEVSISFEVIRTPLKTKVIIMSGKSHVFFERRELEFDGSNII